MELTPLEMAKKIAKILDTKKAEELQVIGIGDITVLADYFVICTANSTTQVKALADEVEFQMTALGLEPHHTEGYRSSQWVLLDYSSVVVHIFVREAREFYKLERLWADGEKVDLQDIVTE